MSPDGKIALNVIPDYQKTAEELVDESCSQITGKGRDIAVGTIERYYGSSKIFLSTDAERLSPDTIADKLSKLSISEAVLVEYSTNLCDYKSMSTFLSSVNQQYLMPPCSTHSISAYHILANNLLKGFKNLSLEGIFPLICPKSRVGRKHHEADNDALKLRETCMEIYSKALSIGESPGY